MKTKFFSLFVLLFIAGTILFISCKKSIDDTETTPVPAFAIPAASPVVGSVSGVIVDENNSPIPAADITYAGIIYHTDAQGFFDIKNVTLDKYVSTVTVNKTGYFKALRSFSANATRNYLTIKLIPKTLAGSVSSTTGGSISLSNGTGITFLSNSIITKSTGAAYTGAVKVYASYIDPTSSDFSARVPGSMMGQDAANMYVLQSTGMIAVDLESPAGEALQLATGMTASIKLSIPASLTGKAPATIDTWSLDDRGVWKKEGQATKNGDFYDMQVTHFSFWNCDVPANAIYLNIHVQDQNNLPLANALVQLTIPNNNTWWATTSGITDSLGNVSGLVPANLGLVMNISSNASNCPAPIATQNIGPFNSNAAITASVTLSAVQLLTVTGTANNCSNQPIQNGTVIIYAGQFGSYHATIVNGTYTTTIVHCASITTLNVTAYDYDTQAQASSGNVTVSGSNVTVPLLTTCNTTQPALYNYTGYQISGLYYPGVALTAANAITAIVEVIVPGPYSVNTITTNGISFAASGMFTTTGLQSIVLQGSGTPIATGSYTYVLLSSGGQNTGVVINVTNQPPPAAVFTFGGPGNCPGAVISGNYFTGIMLGSNNTVTLTVNVTTVGSYFINTGTSINGMSFSDSGTFVSTGAQAVTLYGYGAPLVQGNYTFQAQAANVPGCVFVVNTTQMSNADFTFAGAPGACSGVQVSGTYITAIPLNSQNLVTLLVNVTTPGNFAITSTSGNGISFSSTGVFTTLGVQSVTLSGTGTPLVSGVNAYTASASGIPGCSWSITTN
ncbi:MAG: hypothetical protein ABI741_06275 [Ferruginibacter sp.]